MRLRFLIGLLASAFILLLGPNSTIAAEKSGGVATYVKAEAQNGKIKGDVIEIVREQTGRQDPENGQSGSSKRLDTGQGMSGSGKYKENYEGGMSGSGQRRTSPSGISDPEESPEMEEMPEPDTESGDIE